MIEDWRSRMEESSLNEKFVDLSMHKLTLSVCVIAFLRYTCARKQLTCWSWLSGTRLLSIESTSQPEGDWALTSQLNHFTYRTYILALYVGYRCALPFLRMKYVAAVDIASPFMMFRIHSRLWLFSIQILHRSDICFCSSTSNHNLNVQHTVTSLAYSSIFGM